MGVAVRYGAYLDQITFIGKDLKDGRHKIFGPYGGPGGPLSGIMFGTLQAFYGSSGDTIDRIGLKGNIN